MVINVLSHTFNLFFLIATLCISMCAGIPNMKSCAKTDKQALLKLKAGFIDDYGILSSWKHEVDCCEWNGVSCNPLTGHVTELHVPSNYSRCLRGKIDSSLCDLQHLTHLNLSFNDFGGNQIRKCIGSLNQLRELIFRDANLSGIIPHELRNLSNLQILDFGKNYGLISTDLEWISNVSSLRHLDLSQANLSKTIGWESSLSRKAPQLRELILSGADLVGTIGHQLGNLSNLETLDLSGNDLIMNDLKWISQLPFLRHLDLSCINLSQAIDWQSSLSKVSSLFELDLTACALPQVNPKSLVHNNFSTPLTSLSLSANYLDASILYWVTNISKTLVEIDLSSNSFQYIPAGSFSNMKSLKILYLSSTSLQHVASSAFTNTTSLEHLDLSKNNLTNDIGEAISHLCPLRDLLLSFNNLSGPLRDWVPQLHCAQHSIEELDLSDNSFSSGPFPDVSKFLSLVSLNLRHTCLNGPIPQSLGHLHHLSDLDISHNNLSGPFPKLHELSSFFKWVPPFQLDEFYARSCNFSVGFPMWLKHQRELWALDISNGSISDSIPEWIWLFPYLLFLDISHNQIYGELPKSLPKSGIVWDFSFNNLSGAIPQFSQEVTSLLLSNNMFSGSISSLCATLQSQLKDLDMSSNLLSGKLPHCWSQFPFLEALILANNNFSGSIPSSIGALENIETIHLNNNSFSGKIPSLRFPVLEFIDFGQNNLYGELPTWIGLYLPNLIVLRLQSNQFQGNIPTSLCELSLLQILDLSQNNITGTIPYCLNNLSALSNLTFPRYTISYNVYVPLYEPSFFIEYAMLNWKGEVVKYDKNLGLMTAIDLSGNHLIGEIPSSLTSLVALASLNLSRNNLTGFIPKSMGQMKMLESLDLSSNFLSGGIPMSFSALNFLSFLNLSFNYLSGEIPQTTQLQTFDASSYIGNHGLCGQPLTKGCSRNSDTDPNRKASLSNDANEKDELATFGYYITMILGFLVGFWGVCGTLILKSSWRAAYFQFFTNMYDWIYVRLVIILDQVKKESLPAAENEKMNKVLEGSI
ncbi:receptor-like protein EIX2 [Neltuma alba]|uniref:receptor-like protein EIX2 n=1 Tax=Neltuma alba TaxID=207710 RepID=UPI0010A44571|nr:receptor-like protein EIX2 [Prosopis alba]